MRQLVRFEHVEMSSVQALEASSVWVPYDIASSKCNWAVPYARPSLGCSAAAKMERFQIDAVAGFQATGLDILDRNSMTQVRSALLRQGTRLHSNSATAERNQGS